MNIREGKYTVETFARERNISRQSAINLLSKLKQQGLVTTTGGGSQKRIYTVRKKPIVKTNGFYDIVNKYSPEQLVPRFKHKIYGRYTIEHAIIDGIMIGDSRTLHATKYLFKHITNWKRLFDLAKEKNVTKETHDLYENARKTVKCKTMPKKYQKKQQVKR